MRARHDRIVCACLALVLTASLVAVAFTFAALTTR